jgi:hypothetical protein
MMTEPDLVSVGAGACINGAHVICHTNTKARGAGFGSLGLKVQSLGFRVAVYG